MVVVLALSIEKYSGPVITPRVQYGLQHKTSVKYVHWELERRIDWNFDRTPRTPRVLVESKLGTGETPGVVWELRIRRELEEKGWTACYTGGSGLDDKAAGTLTRKCHSVYSILACRI